MRLLAKEKVNQGRQLEIDLLKALCIIGMIFNRVFEDLTTYDAGLIEILNEYLVVLIGSGMFMFCMGLMRNETFSDNGSRVRRLADGIVRCLLTKRQTRSPIISSRIAGRF